MEPEDEAGDLQQNPPGVGRGEDAPFGRPGDGQHGGAAQKQVPPMGAAAADAANVGNDKQKPPFEETDVALEPVRNRDTNDVFPETAGLTPYGWLHGFVTEQRAAGRTIKVITLIGPSTAGKTFMLFRLAKLMKNSHILVKRDSDGALPLEVGIVERSNVICAYRFKSTKAERGEPDYLIIDCPGERYDRFIEHAAKTKTNSEETDTPASVLDVAACLYWADAVALAMPAMQVLDAKTYLDHGDSLTFSSDVRADNLQDCETLISNFMLLRECMQEIKAWRREANGKHEHGAALLDARLARYTVDQKRAAGMSDIPIKLLFTQADEMMAFSGFADDCDANPVALVNKSRGGDERLTTTLANQYTFASWDFITAFDMPNKRTMRAQQTPNPKSLPYSETGYYGMNELLGRWLHDHAPEPLLVRPNDVTSYWGKAQWYWRLARERLPFAKRWVEKLFGAPWHVASQDLLPLALAKRG